MESFSALLAFCAGNSPVTGEFPSQRPVTRSFDVSFHLHPNKPLSKQSWAGDLRRHRAHYHVIVMEMHEIVLFTPGVIFANPNRSKWSFAMYFYVYFDYTSENSYAK